MRETIKKIIMKVRYPELLHLPNVRSLADVCWVLSEISKSLNEGERKKGCDRISFHEYLIFKKGDRPTAHNNKEAAIAFAKNNPKIFQEYLKEKHNANSRNKATGYAGRSQRQQASASH